MKFQRIAKAEYVTKFGQIGRARGLSEEDLELYRALQTLPIVEYLVVEIPKGSNPASASTYLQTKLRKFAQATNANFVPRVAKNKLEGHLVLWKEAKMAAAAGR